MIISVNRRGGGWNNRNSKDNPPVPSSAIQCNHAQSSAIKRNQAHRGEEVAIQCYPVLSSAIQCNHAQSRTIKRNQAHRGEEVDDEGPDLTRVGHVKEDLGHRGEGLRVL